MRFDSVCVQTVGHIGCDHNLNNINNVVPNISVCLIGYASFRIIVGQ